MAASVRIPSTRVEQVRKVLQCNERSFSVESTPLDDITLVKGVTPKQYRNWACRNEEVKSKQWGVKIEYADGRIIATELAGRAHALAIGRLIEILAPQNANRAIGFGVDEDVDFAQGQQYKADLALNVKGNYNGPLHHLVNVIGGYYTSVIIEIGIAQTGPDLCQKLALYSTIPSIEIYLAIKAYSSGGMVAVRFDRANNWQPVSMISFGLMPLHHTAVIHLLGQWPSGNGPIGVGFGGPACDALNVAPYVISLPTNVIFQHRHGGVLAGTPTTFDIDLFEMQDVLGI